MRQNNMNHGIHGTHGKVVSRSSIALVRAMHRARVARALSPENRREPEQQLILLADEVLRLRRIVERLGSSELVGAIKLALDRYDTSEKMGMSHSDGNAWWSCAWAMADDLRQSLRPNTPDQRPG